MSHRTAGRPERPTRLLLVVAAILTLVGVNAGKAQLRPEDGGAEARPATTLAHPASTKGPEVAVKRSRHRSANHSTSVHQHPAAAPSGSAPGDLYDIVGELQNSGYQGDGVAGTQALLAIPTGITVDASGNQYIADTVNNLIRSVPAATSADPSPSIKTIAGFPPPDQTYTDQIVFSCGQQIYNGSPASSCNLNGFPATSTDVTQSAALTTPSDVKVDADGDVYILNAGEQVLNVIYNGGAQLATTLARLAIANPGVGYENPTKGYIYTLAGTIDTPSSFPATTASAGEAGPAVSGGGLVLGATFGGFTVTQEGGGTAGSGPDAMFLDTAGNVYIADTTNNLVRLLYEGGTVPPVLNALHLTPTAGDIYTIAGTYQLGSDGFNDCSTAPCGEAGLATSASLNFPSGVTIDSSGNVYIGDENDNTIRVVYVGGSVPGVSSTTLAGFVEGNIYTIAGNVSGVGTYSNSCQASATPSNTDCGDRGPASLATLNGPTALAVDLSGNLYVSDEFDNVVRVIYLAGSVPNVSHPTVGNIYTVAGTIAGAGENSLTTNYCILPSDNNCGLTSPASAATEAMLTSPVGLALDSSNNLYLADSGDSVIDEVVGIAPIQPQTITFPAANSPALPTSVVYGAAPIALKATASSGLPVSFAVSGAAHLRGSTAVIDEAGTITITATQSGNSAYSPAPPVTVTIQVTPAQLTVTGAALSLSFGSPVPDFSGDYAVAGFQYSDSQTSATTGQPSVTPNPAYTPTTPVGTVLTLVVAPGTLAAKNGDYDFTFVDGSVTVTGGRPQSITFAAIPNQVYGARPITLAATASSGLPLTYTVTNGASAVKLSGALLTITGVASSVDITATQSGNSVYAPATPVTQTFSISPAPLVITANNITVIQGGTLPALTYTITGFVNGDTQATASTGIPELTTTATSSDPIGTYPITITSGSFAAPNYAPSYVNGVLTIKAPTPQTISFPAPTSPVVYGASDIPLTAAASSGLPVSYTVSGPGILVNSSLQVTGVGTITVTATQTGSGSYGPAPQVSRTVVVTPAVLTVTASSYTIAIATNDPPLAYTISGFVDGDTNAVVTGSPVLTSTDMGSDSPPGNYAILISIGTLSSSNYIFNLVPGSITVLPGAPPDFQITSSSTSITMAAGQVQQTTILAIPVNGYVNQYDAKAVQGGITFSCGNLPAKVTCTFSPVAVSVNGATYLAGAFPPGGQQTTLTISSGAVVASERNQANGTQILPAAIFWLPGGLAGALLALNRRRFAKVSYLRQGVVLLVLLGGVAGMGACGYSNSQNTSAFAQGGSKHHHRRRIGSAVNQFADRVDRSAVAHPQHLSHDPMICSSVGGWR